MSTVPPLNAEVPALSGLCWVSLTFGIVVLSPWNILYIEPCFCYLRCSTESIRYSYVLLSIGSVLA